LGSLYHLKAQTTRRLEFGTWVAPPEIAGTEKNDDVKVQVLVTAVEAISLFAGAADAAFAFVRSAWRKIFGGFPVTVSPGNARIAAIKMGLAINKLICI
jgi:hypothetical protein